MDCSHYRNAKIVFATSLVKSFEVGCSLVPNYFELKPFPEDHVLSATELFFSKELVIAGSNNCILTRPSPRVALDL